MTPGEVHGWLAGLQQECDAATPGPWEAYDEHGELGPEASRAWTVGADHPDGSWSHDLAYLSADAGDPVGTQEIADARFMASSRSSVPTLIGMALAALDLADRWDSEPGLTVEARYFREVLAKQLRAALAASATSP